MDGSSYTEIDTGYTATGITLGPDGDRLYWADYSRYRIMSSFRTSTGPQAIVQLDYSTRPWGIATVSGSLYWGNIARSTLQRSLITGEEIVTIYSGTDGTFHLINVPSQDLNESKNENVSNPCDGHRCSHICVLKGKESCRCLCPEGWSLAQDPRTCTHPNVHPNMPLSACAEMVM